MSQAKSVLIGAALAKLESAYGAGDAVSAGTDQQQLAEPFELTKQFLDLGERDPQVGAIGPYQMVVPSGPYWTGTAKFRPRGNSTTYSASVFPLDTHVFLRASAHDSAFTVTKQTYTPSAGPVSFASLSLEGYARGQKVPLKGVYSDFAWSLEAGKIPLFEFPFMGLPNGAVTDAAPPAITYNTTAKPPKAVGCTFSIGSYLLGVVKSASFKKNHKIEVRPNAGAGTPAGVIGFAYDRFNPVLSVKVEAPAFVGTPFHAAGGIDPFQLHEAGTAVALSIVVNAGAAAQDKWTFAAAQAYLMSPPKFSEQGPVACWDLEFLCAPSSPTALDHYSLVFGA